MANPRQSNWKIGDAPGSEMPKDELGFASSQFEFLKML
jgi:hypothetical protein